MESILTAPNKSKIADMAAIWKIVTPPYLCCRSTDFDAIYHGDAYWRLTAARPFNQDGGGISATV